MYFSDVNNRIPPTQVETVLTTPNDPLIGIPTTVNAIPIVEIPLITPTEPAAVSVDLDDNGKLTFTFEYKVINFGNINEGLIPPSRIRELGINRLKLMGFTNITDEDIHPYKSRYKYAREKVGKLGDDLNERSKAITSSSTTDTRLLN